MTTIQVVLVDDHPLVRKGIRMLLKRAADIKVVGEADNGVEALQLVEKLNPDVLVLDMEMPGMNGVEVARQLHESGFPIGILALSAYTDQQYILGSLASGVAGYLTKEEASENIVKAVRKVADGEQGWVSQKVATRMADWFQTKEVD